MNVGSILSIAGACMVLTQQAGGDRYRQEVEEYRRQREKRLTADDGWLTVTDLYWLKPGVNRFGAGRANDLVLPASAPDHAGTFSVQNGEVAVDAAPGVPLMLGAARAAHRVLRSDADGARPDVLALGSLTLQIIDRGGRLAVRVKDKDSLARRQFKGLAWYPVNPAYRVAARFVPHDRPATITVPSIIGVAEPMPSPGTAVFEIEGRVVRLDPVIEPGETKLFFIFRDATSGKTTYGTGRFLYADAPEGGQVILDFNKAYSPPCAFTPFATCPLPPPQNRLAIPIAAGELTPPH